jgi:Zn-dependent protease with chaperone function
MQNYKKLIEDLQKDFNISLQVDLENGTSWLNNSACEEFFNQYPSISEAIQKLLAIEIDC